MHGKPAVSTAAPRCATRSHRLMITLCLGAVWFYWISLYLYAPTLPSYVASKVSSLGAVGAILSMYGLWQAMVRIPLGIAADWVGRRKPFIIGGLALSALGAVLIASAQSPTGLYVGRAITGLAAGTWVPLVVLFSSLYPPEESVKASALLTMVGNVGRILATGVTGSLNQLGGYSLPFYLAAGAALVAILIIVPTRDVVVREAQPPRFVDLARLIARRDVLLPSVLSLIIMYANWGATFSFIPLLAQNLGASDIVLSLLLSMNLTMIVLGNLLATAIVSKLGPRVLVYTSFALLSVGVCIAGLAQSLAWVFGAQFLIGLSVGIGYPILMGLSIRRIAESQRATAMGMHQAIYAIGMFAGPAASGVIADAFGLRSMFIVTALCCLALGVILTRLLARGQKE